MLFVSVRVFGLRIEARRITAFSTLHFCITWQRCLHQEETLPKRFPQVFNIKPGLWVGMGMDGLWYGEN